MTIKGYIPSSKVSLAPGNSKKKSKYFYGAGLMWTENELKGLSKPNIGTALPEKRNERQMLDNPAAEW